MTDTEIDFLKIAQDEMRDLRGDASTAEYIAGLLEDLYFACPQSRQDLNQQWDNLQGVSMTDLILSKTEKQSLIRFYKTDPAINEERPTRQPEEAYWYGVQIGDRMFDLAISREEESGPESCAVFECFFRNGNWYPDLTRDWFLSEALT